MQCTTCGTTGAGTYCAQCGSPMPGVPDETSSDVFWADGDATRVADAAPTNHWQDADQVQGTTREPASSTAFPGYPWAAGQGGAAAPPPTPSPGPAGYPPPQGPPDKGSTWPLAVGAALAAGLLILAIGGGALWFLTSDDSDTAGSGAASTETSTATSTSDQTTSSDPTTTTITTTSTSSSSTSPEEELGDLRDESLTRLSTDGQWAVSLSAKQDGTRDDRQTTRSGSHVFRLPDILDLHEEYESTYSSSASVYLVKAEDLGSSSGPDASRIWMTIVDPGGLSSREDAATWCEMEFPWLSGDDLDNACYPRQLTSP